MRTSLCTSLRPQGWQPPPPTPLPQYLVLSLDGKEVERNSVTSLQLPPLGEEIFHSELTTKGCSCVYLNLFIWSFIHIYGVDVVLGLNVRSLLEGDRAGQADDDSQGVEREEHF